jgi:hypothetical protein
LCALFVHFLRTLIQGCNFYRLIYGTSWLYCFTLLCLFLEYKFTVKAISDSGAHDFNAVAGTACLHRSVKNWLSESATNINKS